VSFMGASSLDRNVADEVIEEMQKAMAFAALVLNSVAINARRLVTTRASAIRAGDQSGQKHPNAL